MNPIDPPADDQSRRSFIKKAAYVAPLVLTLKADPALASYGSGNSAHGKNAGHGNNVVHGNNGVGNGPDPQPPGNPPVNDAPGTGPGNPGRRRRP